MKQTKRIAIIGGGAAGMMVAATLLERQDLAADIHLFEKNSRLGAKVIISGGGRCNVTTGCFKMQDLLPKYPRGAAFLKPALEQFGPRAIRRWFESHGVSLKQEADGRIFPVSDNGKDIVGVFETLFANGRVQVHLKEGIETITYTPAAQGPLFQLTTSQGIYEMDMVVLTTGGNAYAHTGSTGDGYARARGMGHTITPLGPSLNSFLTAETWLHGCSGSSFPDAQLNTSTMCTSGPVLLTHFGISGPAVFAFSAHIPYEQISKDQPYQVNLQLDASRGFDQRLQQFTERAVTTPKKELGNLLRQGLVKKVVDAILAHFGYDPHLPIGNLSKLQRGALARLFGDGIPLELIQRRPGDEFVTAGGVSLDEIDPQTGQSRKVPGLYFAGEILDVDGYTGGYNLTSSRAMGAAVGRGISD